MDLKSQILTALGIDKTINLEWQSKLEDGTIVVSTAETLEAGVDASVLTEDGTTIPLPIGTYKTEDGVSFRIEEEGVVAEVMESETEEVVEEEMEEEADVQDWAGMEKRIENLEIAVAKLKEDKVGGDTEMEDETAEEDECPNGFDDDGNCIEEEELSKPSRNPKTIKTTEVKEFNKLKAENKKLKEKLAKSPAEAPLTSNKFSSQRTELSTKEYKKLSSKDKFLYDLNK
tara:strand:+ start:2610 stop:3299 length:690 start_codon:yes stop_codon:yes gene_type:complete